MITTGTQSVKWKESWQNDFLKTLRGLANAEGGILLIGPSNDENPVDLHTAPKLLDYRSNKIRELLGIIFAVKLLLELAFAIVEIRLPAYTAPKSYRGRYYQRVGSTMQEITGAAFDRFLLRRQGRNWGGVLLQGFSLIDLDARKISRFRARTKTCG